MATLPPRHDLESKKGSAAAPLSTKFGAGNESRTRDLNLGKANGAPNCTATHLDVTANCAELRGAPLQIKCRKVATFNERRESRFACATPLMAEHYRNQRFAPHMTNNAPAAKRPTATLARPIRNGVGCLSATLMQACPAGVWGSEPMNVTKPPRIAPKPSLDNAVEIFSTL